MELKRKPKHYYVENAIYFITTHTFNFEPIFSDPKLAEILYNKILEYKGLLEYNLHSFVIMPHHLHIMLDLPSKTNISYIMFRLKGSSSREINKLRGVKSPIWQDRFYDHMIRDERDYVKHMDYIHFNPVKHGLVYKPEEWKWSSFLDCINRRNSIS